MSLFGSTTTPAFGFAAPASTPSIFGATTPAFGTTTPAFGATTPAFGATTPAAPILPFGATPAAATGSLFGNATPAFGVPAAAPATTSLFGAPAQPSLFGGAAASAPATASFGGFGAAPAAATGSAFGFGAPAAAAPAPFNFASFSTPAPAVQTSMFGATATQPQQQQQLVAAGPGQMDLAAIRELEALKDSFVGGASSSRFRFQYLFLNVVDNPAARVKPAGVDDLAWREALGRCGGPDNGDRLWPVLATGLSDLLQREGAQQVALQEHQQRLELLARAARDLARKQQTLLRDRLEGVKRREVELGQMLLRAMRQIDALEGRLAAAMGVRSPATKGIQGQLQSTLAFLEEQLTSSSASSLARRAEAVSAAAALRAGAASSGGMAAMAERIDSASMGSIFSLLKQQNDALRALEGVLHRDNRDIAIMLQGGSDVAPMAIVRT